MERKIAAAVIGCGWAGAIHAEAYATHPQSHLVAVCDPDIGKARQLAHRLNCRAYDSLEALLAAEQFEVASIASPTETHVTIGKKLLQTGIATLCEKPLSRDVLSAYELVASATSGGRPCGVNYNRRFAKGYQMAKERLGRSGGIRFVSCILAQNVPLAQTNELRAQLPEDFLVFDALSHILDLVVHLVGKPRQLFAFGSKAEPNLVWTDIEVALSFENGAIGNLICSLSGPEWGQLPIERLEIATETERIIVENIVAQVEWFGYREQIRHIWQPSIFEPTGYIASMIASIHAWVDAVIHGTPPPIPVEEGAYVVKLCEQVRDALKSQAKKDTV